MDVIRRASQVALICNLFFLLCVLLRYFPFVKDQVLVSIILILGWLMAFWLNAAVSVAVMTILGWRRLQRIPYPGSLPGWLPVTNLGIGMVQVYFFFLQ